VKTDRGAVLTTRKLVQLVLGLGIGIVASATVASRADAVPAKASGSPGAANVGRVYFDGRARKMRTLYSTSTTDQAQLPRVWDCLCFTNNDIQLVDDKQFGRVYVARAAPGSRNPWNTAAPSNDAASQLSTRRASYGLGNTYWYAIAFKLDSTWTQPDWATLVTFGYPTLSSGPIDIDVYPMKGVLSYVVYMNSGLLTKNAGGFYQGAVFGRAQIAPVVFGKWVEIVLGIRWATDKRGSVDAYYRLAGKRTWTHSVSRRGLPTAQYGTTSYGTATAAGLNPDGSRHTVLDKEGLYFGYYNTATTTFPARAVYESGLTRSSTFAAAARTLP
jgi:hypothetical protein